MGKYLVVGDVHATVNELEDCQALIDLVADKTDKLTTVVFLGDQYHTHAMVRVEVIDFWNRAFGQLTKVAKKVVAVVGNHDMPGDFSKSMNAMMANQLDGLEVIDRPTMEDGILFMPYYHDADSFVKTVNEYGAHAVICHQTFNGAKYENGFYAKDGADPEALECSQVISGHIHTPSIFGKVEYVGAPRWRTASDANIDRFIHLYEKDRDGTLKLVEKFSTAFHCKRILKATVYEDGTYEGRTDALDKDTLHIDIHGSKQFCEQKRAELATENFRIRTFPKTEKVVKVKESEGIDLAFRKYIDSYCKGHGLDTDKIQQMATERLGGLL